MKKKVILKGDDYIELDDNGPMDIDMRVVSSEGNEVTIPLSNRDVVDLAIKLLNVYDTQV